MTPSGLSTPARAGRAAGTALRLLVLAVGLCTLATGVGLGPRHYAKEGLDGWALPGFALVLLGLLLSAWAAFRLLRGIRRRWWPLGVAGLLVVSYLALWTLGQAVAGAFPPRPELGAETPSDRGLAYEEVDLETPDGVHLAGWYVPGRNRAAVAVMHGAGSTRSAVLDHAVVLARHGYGVLLLDARGHGESGGRGMDFGWYGELDAAGAVDFLVERDDVDPRRVALLGLSMGGEQAVGAAGADDRVRAVVAEGVTARVAEDKGYLVEAYGVRGRVQQWIDGGTSALTDLLSGAPRPGSLRQAVSLATERPEPTRFLLVVAGEVPDEAHAARYVRGGAPRVDTWTVPGSGHTGGLHTDPAGWERRVIAFLDDALRE